ncbi:hypothetical protein OG203_21850 [Nocardia sp. NBC_01499]|uniref:hypothetical protein n=1 Tax=Nocardia sp. NBC_01499 TaxID=2903597 RepID=UPI0038660CB4
MDVLQSPIGSWRHRYCTITSIHRQTGEKMLLPGVGSFLGAAVAALGVILAIIIAAV